MHRNSNSRDVGSLVLEGGGRAGRFGRLLGSYFRADRAGIVAFGVILLLCASFAHAQTGIRWDLGAPGSAGAVAAAASGGLPTLLAQPGVTLAWCNHPANAVPCTNYATTYTSLLLSTPCATNAQIVLQGSTTCQAQSDFMGDLGVYTATNTVCTVTCYDYTLTVNGVSYGPYVWTQGGTSSGGGSLPTASAQGQVPAATGAGTTYAAQTKATIDVRDKGVDCTGATDASAALNAIFTAINQTEVDFPYFCQMRVDHQVVIQSQSGWVLKGLGDRPGVAGFGGPSIYGCNGAAGAVLYINRSGYGRIEGLGIYPKGPVGVCGSSSFTGSVQIDSTGNPGVTTHDIILDHVALTTSPVGGAIANYVGLSITDGGKQNGEMIRVSNSWIHCQNSSGSIGISNTNGTSDNDVVDHNHISSCRYGIQNTGNIRILGNLLSSNGVNSVFGAFGAAIYSPQCSSGLIAVLYNEADAGGPFIDAGHTGSPSCATGFNVIGNAIGVSDIANGEYVIDVGQGGGQWNVQGNSFLVTVNTGQYIIGNNSQAATHGPLGFLSDQFNDYHSPTPSNTLGVNDPIHPFQLGETHTLASSGTVLLGPNISAAESSSLSKLWFPDNIDSTQAQQSPYLGLRSYTGAANDDWLLQSIASASISAFTFNHNAGPASTLWFNWDGQVNGLRVAQLSTPAAPAGVTTVGASGGTTYTYAIVAFGQAGNTAGSPTLSTNNGNASLSGSNYNHIQWTVTASLGANRWCVWRTVGGATQGNIGCVFAIATSANSKGGDQYYLDDTGLTGDGSSLPSSNTTGQIITPTLNTTDGTFGSTQTATAAACETSFGATTLSTIATTTNTGLNCLPANAVIDAVVYRITVTITTAVSFTVGDGTTAARFCSTQNTMTAGTTGVCFVQADQTGAAGPRQTAAAAVRVTTNANPGAGAIRLIVYYHTWTAPTS